MESTDQRLERLERRLAEIDAMLEKLQKMAAGHPVGRVLLKTLGLG